MIVNPHHELILLAAEMAQGTGLPSEFPEDRGFCKTTPVKERRRIIAELELSRQTARVWAQRVRAAADLIVADRETLLAMIRHQQDVLRECLPYLNESMAGRRPGRSADDIRAAVKALTTDSAASQPSAVRDPLIVAVQQIMARLADLLDDDQFNNIERIALDAGVPYPPLRAADNGDASRG